ncbi:hypothetical protein ERO13_A09G021833v2 [Gossypium hirsutum]|nr:hypothetical protein ERO13_A09G021833v2 [Gossypium hirsutum]
MVQSAQQNIRQWRDTKYLFSISLQKGPNNANPRDPQCDNEGIESKSRFKDNPRG